VKYKKKIYTLLYIALISSFIATLVSYNLPKGIKDIARSFLPIRVAKKINFLLSANSIEFSNFTIGFVGVLITFGIFAGISLIFVRRRPDVER